MIDLQELRKRMDEYADLSREERQERLDEAEREIRAIRAAEKMARRFDALDVAGIPPALMGVTLDQLETHGENYDAITAARAWQVNAAANVTMGRGMLLIGPPGVGKTHIVCSLVREAVRRCTRPITVKYLNWSHFIAAGNRSWTKRDADAVLAKAEADLLILDELGGATARQSWASDADELLLEMLDLRLYGGRQRRGILATTNKLHTEMAATIGGRQWSRLKALAPEMYGIAGRDYRG